VPLTHFVPDRGLVVEASVIVPALAVAVHSPPAASAYTVSTVTDTALAAAGTVTAVTRNWLAGSSVGSNACAAAVPVALAAPLAVRMRRSMRSSVGSAAVRVTLASAEV
jgi:predicted lipoprotein with Yx(FWY)xxD motif